jgi:hypothetical protein
MSVRQLVTGVTLGVLCSLLLGGTTAARADGQAAAVMWHPQTGQSGAVGSAATATLVRRDDGLSIRFSTEHLRPGHAYTLWFVVLNNPDACAATPCSAQDILLNPDTSAQVTYATGHVSGGSGRATLAASFRVGALDGWLPGAELSNPRTAEVQLVLNDHGPVLKGYMPEMIKTYRSGCTDASLPAIFPPSARADGTPGPNACQLYQMAVFSGS